jgi:hypothetical protein
MGALGNEAARITADFLPGFPVGDAMGHAPVERNGFGKQARGDPALPGHEDRPHGVGELPCENPPWSRMRSCQFADPTGTGA